MPGVFKAYRTASGRSVLEMLTEHGNKAKNALGQGLYREGQGIISQSVGLCPVDTGALKGSAYTQPPVEEEGLIRVYLGYGGPAAQINPKTHESTDGYALYVHENLEAFHPVGMAKFLEIPFSQAERGMGARIAEFMRGKLKTNAAIGDFVVGETEAESGGYLF